MEISPITLLFGILLLASVLTIVFIYILLQQVFEQRSQANMNQFKNVFSDKLLLYLMEGEKFPANFLSNSRLKRRAIEEMLTGYISNISSDEILSRVSAYAEKHLKANYRKQLKSFLWSTRMNVLFKISDFKLAFLMDDVLKMLNSQKKYSKEEYMQMYQLLALFHSEDLYYHLLYPKVELGEWDCRRLLRGLNEEQIERLVLLYNHLPYPFQLSLIEMIGIKHLGEQTTFLEDRLQEDKEEVRIRALKSIERIGLIRNFSIYLPFEKSIHWEERLMFAKLLAVFPPEISLPRLTNLLRDTSWWVRNQSARSVYLQKNGSAILKEILASSDDRFVIDIAIEVLEEVKG